MMSASISTEGREAQAHSVPVLSLIVPVKDEEEALQDFFATMPPILDALPSVGGEWEILFIDDGSTDATLEGIRRARDKDARIKVASLSRNFGKEAALTAGLDLAGGQAVIPFDVDMQDPPDVITQMVEKWRQGFEIVYGIRQNRDSDSWAKRTTANLFYRVHNTLADDRIPENVGDFRLMDRVVVDAIRRLPERNRVMKALFSWSGFRSIGIPYSRVQRQAGATKFNFWKLWLLAVDSITSSSTVPLRIWSYIGVAVALAAIVYGGGIFVYAILGGIDVPGYASIIVTLLFLNGLQMISLGILGEYVGRILIETKERPLYVVRFREGI